MAHHYDEGAAAHEQKTRAPRSDKGIPRGPKKPPATAREEWLDFFAAHDQESQRRLLENLALIQRYQFRDMGPAKVLEPEQAKLPGSEESLSE